MPALNLVRLEHPDSDAERFEFLYAHATLHRLFRRNTDGRTAFWSEVPGITNFVFNPEIDVGSSLPNTEVYLSHSLLQFPQGWVNIFGGTEPPGWFQHALSAMAVPLLHPHFPTYWKDLAQIGLAIISTRINVADARPICFSGHSLGGATAVAAAYFDHERGVSRTRTVVSFGSPKARGTAGMDGRDFDHYRVQNEYDIVPYLPLNPFPFKLVLAPLKVAISGMHHYGRPVVMSQGYEVDSAISRCPTWGLPFVFFGSADFGFFGPHFMDAYAHELRAHIGHRSLSQTTDFWDRANAYCNAAEGIDWNIAGFPIAAPPALPSDFTPPTTTTDQTAALAASAALWRPITADLLHPEPAVPVQENVSFAAYLAGVTGRDIRDISIWLSNQPIPDPTDITLSSFNPANFDGFNPVRGLIWKTTPPVGGYPQRYSTRAAFTCNGSVTPNDIHAFYVLAHEGPGDSWRLAGFHQFAAPVRMDRVRTLCLEITVSAGSP